MSIFDSLIHVESTGKPVSSYADAIRKCDVQYKNAALDKQELKNCIAAKEMYKFARTYKELYIGTGNSKVYLHTPFFYSASSSLSHVDDTYTNSTEFIMRSSSHGGVTLNGLFKNLMEQGHENLGLYGNKTLSILAAMGFQTVLGNEGHALELKPVDDSKPNSASGRGKSMIAFLFTIFLII